jgi:hypothetical protein
MASIAGRTALMPVQEASALQVQHLKTLLAEIGLWQHAEGDVPHQRHGYSIDDEARGLIVGLRYWEQGSAPLLHSHLAEICFQFIQKAAITSGKSAGHYHNFCDDKGRWLDSVGSDDSFGRTFWGLGIAHAVDAPFAPRKQAELLLRGSLAAIDGLNPWYLRAHAFTLFGLAASGLDDRRLQKMADVLVEAYTRSSDAQWQWFEDGMTYCNARLPQALFIASRLLPNGSQYGEIAAKTLDFLLAKTQNGHGSYDPIGNAHLTTRGWFLRTDDTPALYDQQPVDAGALVECCVEAWHATGEPRFRQAAHDAFGWYVGKNRQGLAVYNPKTGGVADALTPHGLNHNQGAESVLSVHLAYQALQTLE